MAGNKYSNGTGLPLPGSDSASDGGCVDNVIDSLTGQLIARPVTSAQPRMGQPGVLPNIIPLVGRQGISGRRLGRGRSAARMPPPTPAQPRVGQPNVLPNIIPPVGMQGISSRWPGRGRSAARTPPPSAQPRMGTPIVFNLTPQVWETFVRRPGRHRSEPRRPTVTGSSMSESKDSDATGFGTPEQDPAAYDGCIDNVTDSLTGLSIKQPATSAQHTLPRLGVPGVLPNIIPPVYAQGTFGRKPGRSRSATRRPTVAKPPQIIPQLAVPGGNMMVGPYVVPLTNRVPEGSVGPRPRRSTTAAHTPPIRTELRTPSTPRQPLNPYTLMNLSVAATDQQTTSVDIVAEDSPLPTNALGELECELNRYKHEKIFAIRAKGKDNDKTTIYNLMNRNDMRVIGTFFVNEQSENVKLRDSNGLHVLTAIGGILNLNRPMYISWPSNEPLAIVDANAIHIPVYPPTFTFGMPQTYRGQVFTVLNRDKVVVASITDYKDALTITRHLTIENHVSLIIFLHALKLFHIQFRLHRLPMPFGILSSINRSAYRQLPPSLDILNHLGNIRMRLACHIKHRHFFADFIDKISGRIMLIASVKGNALEFKDPCGTTHFVGHFGKGTVLRVSSPPPANDIYGRIGKHNNVLDAQGNEIMMILTQSADGRMLPANDDKPGKMLVLSPDRAKRYAEVSLDKHVVSMDMGIPLSPTIKAMILVKTVRIAIFCYKLEEQISPAVTDYSYARIG